MQAESKHKASRQHTAVCAAILSIVSVILFSVHASAAEPDPVQTVSGQELPDENQGHDQEEKKDDQNSSTNGSEVHNPETDPDPGLGDNFDLEENEMINAVLARLDRLIELLTPEEPEPASVNAEDIMYPDGYQEWPYPIRVRFSIVTSEGYNTEYAVYCDCPEEFEESFRSKLQSIADGSIHSFFVRHVMTTDKNGEYTKLVYDYENPVYPKSEELEDTGDGSEKESSLDELLSGLESINEKMSDMHSENQQISVSGNNLISSLDDTIQEGNEQNRQMITDLFTQGTTYILAFIGIVVGAVLGLILSRYLKHD